MGSDWEYSIIWEKHGHQLLLDHRHLMNFPKGKMLLEIGSDHGEGSTRPLATMAKELGLGFATVDMDPEITEKSKFVAEIDESFKNICGKGEEFIRTLDPESIAILYLDAYDTMPPGLQLPGDMKAPYISRMGGWDTRSAWRMHLTACKEADSRMVPGGLICFDDVWRRNGVMAYRSKGYLAIPWLLSKGYKEINFVEGCALYGKEP